MADKIFLQGSEINTKSIKKAISLLEKVARVKGANFLETSLNDIAFKMQMGVENSYGVRFLSNASEEAESIAGELEAVAANLASLQKHLSDSPEVLEDADKSFKDWNDKREGNWLSRVLNGLFGTTIGGYLGYLFGIKNNEPVETILFDKIDSKEKVDAIPSKEPTQYEQYRTKTEMAERNVPIGHKQEEERSGMGLCTYSATTTLLQRRQAVEGKAVTFTFSDVHRANGGSGQVDDDGIWPDSSFAWGRTYTSDAGESYTMNYEYGGKDATSIQRLLDAHPEGIIVWAPSTGGYNHAVVITDYEISEDGAIRFFADDPVNDRNYINGAVSRDCAGRVPIEDTWLSKVNSDIFGSAAIIAYLE